MKLFNIHDRAVHIQYRNNLCSWATAVIALVGLGTFVLPFYFILWIHPEGLWDRLRSVHEQPSVVFPYRYLFLAELEQANAGGVIVTCSSFEAYNSLTESLPVCTEVLVDPVDSNYDGKLDHLTVSVSFNPPEEAQALSHYTFYFFLEATVQSQCTFRVPAWIALSKVSTPTGAFLSGTVHHRGFLEASQTTALQCPFFMRNIQSHFNHNYYPNENSTLDQFKPDAIARKIVATNPVHYRFASSETATWRHDDSGAITVLVEMSIGANDSPSTVLLYRATLWQKLVQFWSRYFPILLVFLWAAGKLKDFLFERFHLRAVEVVPWKEKYN